MAKETSTALVTTGPAGITLADGQWPLVQRSKDEIDAIAEGVKAAIGSDAYALRGLVQRIGISLAADKQPARYLLPNGTDDPERKAEITGIVIGTRTTRQKYLKSIDESGGGNSPDCASGDGVTGIIRTADDGFPIMKHGRGNTRVACESCPFNRPGDCKQIDLIFVVVPGEHVFPFVIHATPGSLTALTKYKTDLIVRYAKTGKIPQVTDVLTKFSLVTTEPKGGGNPYNRMVFECVGPLDPTAKAQVAGYATNVSGLMDAYARVNRNGGDTNVAPHMPTGAPTFDAPASADTLAPKSGGDDDLQF